MREDYKFKITEDDKVIDLLVSELYAGDPDVSIREAIQNARDANHAYKSVPNAQRMLLGDSNYTPHIGIWSYNGAICISDNGIGMTAKEIDENLLDIGVTQKSMSLGSSPVIQPKISQDGYIGKYGVGVLGYFILAGEVEVYTKSYTADASEEWIKVVASIDKNKNVNVTRINNSRFTTILPYGHPLKLKDAQKAHGTVVVLKPRNAATIMQAEQAFKDRVRELGFIENVEALVARYCLFLDQDIYSYSSGSEKPLILGQNINFDDKNTLKEIFMELEDTSSEPLLMEHKSFDISQYDSKGELFLYLRDNIVYEQKGFDIYVDGLLVEASSTDIRPSWARFIHGAILLKGIGTSLDRRAISKQSGTFYIVKEAVDDACIEILKKFITDKWDIFLEELWPALDGNFIPKLLQAYSGMYTDSAKKEATKVLQEIALLLPVPFIRSTRVHRKGKSNFINTFNSLSRIISSEKNLVNNESGKLEFKYIEDIGSAEAVASKRELYVIDAVKRGSGNNWWKTYLTTVEEMHDSVCFKSWSASDEIESFDDALRTRGWHELLGLFQQWMNYGDLENYEVDLYAYEPNSLPIVISEREIDQKKVEGLKLLLNQVEDQELVKDLMSMLQNKSNVNRTLRAYINANNSLIKELANTIERTGIDNNIIDIIRQIIENGRVDHYGGKYIGQEVLQSIYERVRNPSMLKQLKQGEILEYIVNDDAVKVILTNMLNNGNLRIREQEQIEEYLAKIDEMGSI